ncbi:MAG: hypothetical protein ACLPXM_14620 [Terriglobales bacterium]
MTPDFFFDREAEIEGLRRRFGKRRPFLVHGPSGVGKTFLLQRVVPEFPQVLYSPESASPQTVFRNLALALLTVGAPRLLRTFAGKPAEAIRAKSATALKGIVMDALREGSYCVVLDHLKLPSYAFAAAVREIMGSGSTAVITVARSAHMENLGFLQPFYPERSDRFEIRGFPPTVAECFIAEAAQRVGLSAENIGEFCERVREFGQGNPGAILSMLEMAKHPKYRAAEHIKITPLYLDFRLNWKPAGVQ